MSGDDIELLLEMDPEKLTSKQRRLVRRHKERNADGVGADDDVSPKKDDGAATNSGSDDKKQAETADAKAKDSDVTNKSTSTTSKNTSTATSEEGNTATANSSEILSKLEGLNSKDRRKLLRQLKRDTGDNDDGNTDANLIAAAEEEARRVAERNRIAVQEQTVAEKDKSTKRKAGDEDSTTTITNTSRNKNNDEQQPNKPKNKKRKKKSTVDLSTLSPEERLRREQQRQMQIEAEERRTAGLQDPNYRHPLNSERRRANRRKPSKNALIAMEKREKMAERGKFNQVGYQMRREKKNGDGGGAGGGGGEEYAEG